MNKLDHYIACLKQYNSHTNIYSRKAYDDLPFHVENSTLMCQFITESAPAIADVGSGSGLPAIPLAIAMPNASVTAIESRLKKVTFLKWIKEECQLDNFHIIHDDVRAAFRKPPRRWTIITAKAFSNYETLCKVVRLLPRKPKKIMMPISENQLQTEYLNSGLNIETIKHNQKSHHYIVDTIKSV